MKDILAWQSGQSVALTQPSFVRSQTNSASSTTTVTLSSFNASGGNFVVIAFAMSTTLTRSITSITVNGVSATNIYTTNFISATGGKIALYGLVGPTTGDIVVTINNTFTSASAVAMLFNNVGGVSSSLADFSTSSRTSTSDGLTTIATDLVVDLLATGTNVGTPGGGQTLRAQNNAAISTTTNCSTDPGAAGTTTPTWSFSSQPVSWAGCVLNGK